MGTERDIMAEAWVSNNTRHLQAPSPSIPRWGRMAESTRIASIKRTVYIQGQNAGDCGVESK